MFKTVNHKVGVWIRLTGYYNRFFWQLSENLYRNCRSIWFREQWCTCRCIRFVVTSNGRFSGLQTPSITSFFVLRFWHAVYTLSSTCIVSDWHRVNENRFGNEDSRKFLSEKAQHGMASISRSAWAWRSTSLAGNQKMAQVSIMIFTSCLCDVIFWRFFQKNHTYFYQISSPAKPYCSTDL